MSANTESEWIWSEPHNDYYRVTYDGAGKATYIWGREYLRKTHISQTVSDSNESESSGRSRRDSVNLDPRDHQLARYPTQSELSMEQGTGPDDARWSKFDSEFDASMPRDPSHHLTAGTAEFARSTIVGDLDTGFEVILNPKGFFKKGRVFMVPWPEPGGDSLRDHWGPRVFVKIRRFVVIRPRATFCLCLPIHTYQGQATTKPGLSIQDHAAVIEEGQEMIAHEEEEDLTKEPLSIKIENPDVGSVDPMSRINFGKVYTVEYNVKVRNIGRIIPSSIHKMDQYFSECFRLDSN